MLLSARVTRFVGLVDRLVNQTFRPMLVVISLCMIVGAGTANAEKKLDLYKDTQLVLDQSDKLRQQAMRASLATVLIRVTGDPLIVKQAAIVQALSNPGAYVSQYRYNSTDEVITIAGATRPAQALWLKFSESSILRVLQAAQLPVWPNFRPEILLWVAVDKPRKRILNSDSTSINTFKRIAKTRGLPLAMPLLDLADRKALTAARLWVRDEQAITRASLRYGADGVLAGRIVFSSANRLRGNFVLMYGGRSYYFTAEGGNATEIVQKIMGQSISALANANAVVAVGDSAAPHLLMAVENMADFSSYAELLERLRNISSVRHVMLQEVSSNYLMIDLRYQGSEEKLLGQLSNLAVLQRMPVDQFLEKYRLEESDNTAFPEPSPQAPDDTLKSNTLAETAPKPISVLLLTAAPIIDVAFTWSGSTSR
jgi:hypothetical protein